MCTWLVYYILMQLTASVINAYIFYFDLNNKELN
jgi:hypothetical protein